MPIFSYTAVDQKGEATSGTIDAVSIDVGISSLQRRGLIVQNIKPTKASGSLFDIRIPIFDRIKSKDIVILSRQIATLFEAQVTALRAFRLLADETENPRLKEKLETIANDIQSGYSISRAFSKHTDVFDTFFIQMVKIAEETGKIDETFNFLADHLDRTYEVTAKAKNALVYPAFVIVVFVVVMLLMLTMVIPKLGTILSETGQTLPIYTRIVLGLSNFLVHYFYLLIIGLGLLAVVVYRSVTSENGAKTISQLKFSVPYVGALYAKLYLSRMADSLSTGLASGIQMVRSIEMSAEIVGDPLYKNALLTVARDVQSGVKTSDSMAKNQLFPGIVVAMVRVGEETGDMGKILKTMAQFYTREVNGAVDSLVSLIEPLLIVILALGVGFLLASVLVPIYNISAGL
jgi:type IV pilus assembly protein PilC